jgi:hypothetical protein
VGFHSLAASTPLACAVVCRSPGNCGDHGGWRSRSAQVCLMGYCHTAGNTRPGHNSHIPVDGITRPAVTRPLWFGEQAHVPVASWQTALPPHGSLLQYAVAHGTAAAGCSPLRVAMSLTCGAAESRTAWSTAVATSWWRCPTRRSSRTFRWCKWRRLRTQPGQPRRTARRRRHATGPSARGFAARCNVHVKRALRAGRRWGGKRSWCPCRVLPASGQARYGPAHCLGGRGGSWGFARVRL